MRTFQILLLEFFNVFLNLLLTVPFACVFFLFFYLFLLCSDIRWCYYKDSAKVLGQTFGMLVLQVCKERTMF